MSLRSLAVHGTAIVAQPNLLQSIRKCGRYGEGRIDD